MRYRGTALDYGIMSLVPPEGAALVISTIAKVFGGMHQRLPNISSGFEAGNDRQERVGEIIRGIKRQALIEGSLMALCVVAFGDADWETE